MTKIIFHKFQHGETVELPDCDLNTLTISDILKQIYPKNFVHDVRGEGKIKYSWNKKVLDLDINIPLAHQGVAIKSEETTSAIHLQEYFGPLRSG